MKTITIVQGNVVRTFFALGSLYVIEVFQTSRLKLIDVWTDWKNANCDPFPEDVRSQLLSDATEFPLPELPEWAGDRVNQLLADELGATMLQLMQES